MTDRQNEMRVSVHITLPDGTLLDRQMVVLLSNEEIRDSDILVKARRHSFAVLGDYLDHKIKKALK